MAIKLLSDIFHLKITVGIKQHFELELHLKKMNSYYSYFGMKLTTFVY